MIHPIKSKRKLRVYKVVRSSGGPFAMFENDTFTIAGDFENVTLRQVLRDAWSIFVEWLRE